MTDQRMRTVLYTLVAHAHVHFKKVVSFQPVQISPLAGKSISVESLENIWKLERMASLETIQLLLQATRRHAGDV